MFPTLPLKALIIDDEPAAREDLRRLLRAQPGVVVVGEAGRLAEAGTALRGVDYDLVFLDVELRGGTGFDLLPQVRPEARIVFVTAHSQYAVRAFEINALDYLVKPITEARLAAALRRAPKAGEAGAGNFTSSDLVHLRIGNGTTRFVPLASIAMIESEENYTHTCLIDGTRLLVRRTMKAWEDALPATQFVRVHRTAIVNLAHYRGSDRQSDRTTLLRLEGLPEPVRASFRYLPELRAALSASGKEL